MPIPLLVWGIAAAGAAAVAYINRDKIKSFAESEDGQELINGLKKVATDFAEANYDPETKARMQRHMDHLIEIPLGARLILGPKYLSSLNDQERAHLLAYGHMRCEELERMNDRRAADVRGIVNFLESQRR